jgi:hypothetical protein
MFGSIFLLHLTFIWVNILQDKIVFIEIVLLHLYSLYEFELLYLLWLLFCGWI